MVRWGCILCQQASIVGHRDTTPPKAPIKSRVSQPGQAQNAAHLRTITGLSTAGATTGVCYLRLPPGLRNTRDTTRKSRPAEIKHHPPSRAQTDNTGGARTSGMRASTCSITPLAYSPGVTPERSDLFAATTSALPSAATSERGQVVGPRKARARGGGGRVGDISLFPFEQRWLLAGLLLWDGRMREKKNKNHRLPYW